MIWLKAIGIVCAVYLCVVGVVCYLLFRKP